MEAVLNKGHLKFAKDLIAVDFDKQYADKCPYLVPAMMSDEILAKIPP